MHEKVYRKTNGRVSLISLVDYESTESVVRCNHCNNEFKTSIHTVIRRHNAGKPLCPFCEYCSKYPTREQVDFKISDNDFTIVGELKRLMKDKVLVRHSCGYEYETRLGDIITGRRGCPRCNHRSIAYTLEEAKELLYNAVGDEYSIVGKYRSLQGKTTLRHNVCGHTWDVVIKNILSGTRCPECWRLINRSHGENTIKSILNKFNIKYIEEYGFNDCKNKRMLKFDFYVESLNLLIEYDGRQHFIDYPSYGGMAKLEGYRVRDDIKTNYAISNNINILRINYKANNKLMYEILEKYINDKTIDSTTNRDRISLNGSNSDEYYNKATS